MTVEYHGWGSPHLLMGQGDLDALRNATSDLISRGMRSPLFASPAHVLGTPIYVDRCPCSSVVDL